MGRCVHISILKFNDWIGCSKITFCVYRLLFVLTTPAVIDTHDLYRIRHRVMSNLTIFSFLLYLNRSNFRKIEHWPLFESLNHAYLQNTISAFETNRPGQFSDTFSADFPCFRSINFRQTWNFPKPNWLDLCAGGRYFGDGVRGPRPGCPNSVVWGQTVPPRAPGARGPRPLRPSRIHCEPAVEL